MAWGFEYGVVELENNYPDNPRASRYGVMRRRPDDPTWELVAETRTVGRAQGIVKAIRDADRYDDLQAGRELVRKDDEAGS